MCNQNHHMATSVALDPCKNENKIPRHTKSSRLCQSKLKKTGYHKIEVEYWHLLSSLIPIKCTRRSGKKIKNKKHT